MIGSEFELVLASAQDGDEAAFARLWRDVNPPLVRYLTLFAPGLVDDVAADTWLTVVRGLRQFRGDEGNFRAWVFTTARRRTFDEGRRRTRSDTAARAYAEASTHDEHHDHRSDSGEPAGHDTADVALEQLQTRRLLRLINTLPGKQAEVIVLRVIAGLPVDEVARLVRMSPGAVRVTAHRGLKRLAEVLSSEGVTQ